MTNINTRDVSLSRANADDSVNARATDHSRPSALEFRSWSWRYAGRKDWAARNLTFSVARGERVLLLGASGAGKSTLLKAMAGLLQPGDEGEEHGELLVDGHPSTTSPESSAMVMQDPDAQVMFSTVGDDVAFGCENLGIAPVEISERVDEALRAVDLELPRQSATGVLSGGQKQRLALAGVLAMRPQLLLFDEPTSMLDPQGARQVRDAIQKISASREHTLVIVEHRIDLWVDVVDRVLVLDGSGQLIIDGKPSDVFVNYARKLQELGVWVPGFADEAASVVQVELTGKSPVTTAASVLSTSPVFVVGRRDSQTIELSQSVHARRGQVLALTGANGSGKTTVALTLGGLLAPVAGHIDAPSIADGLAGEPTAWSSPQLAARIASVFQNPAHQFVRATVRAELELSLATGSASKSDQHDPIQNIATKLGLSHLLDANPHSLSGGEQRRLSVATALISGNPLIILDEPTFGQDAHTWLRLAELIVEARDAGAAVVIVSHDEQLLERIADQRIHLKVMRPEATSAATATAPLPKRTNPLSRLNPLTALAGVAVLSAGLLLSLDWVSASIALTAELMLLAVFGAFDRSSLKVLVAVLIASLLTGFSVLLYGQESGESYVEFLFIHVTDGSLELAIATSLRVLAIAVPAVLVAARISPVRLADALEQHTRLPARFVVGALASLQTVATVRDDWDLLARARRARGVGNGSGILRFLSQAFSLLVLALRRAEKLALAMQTRGFDRAHERSWSRISIFTWRDAFFVALCALVTATALALSITSGHWNFIVGAPA